jgi:hypothetical protein
VFLSGREIYYSRGSTRFISPKLLCNEGGCLIFARLVPQETRRASQELVPPAISNVNLIVGCLVLIVKLSYYWGMKKYLITLVFLVLVLGAGYLYWQNNKIEKNDQGQVACTMEAKICPDGVTYVGRKGPNCEFSSCPDSSINPPVLSKVCASEHQNIGAQGLPTVCCSGLKPLGRVGYNGNCKLPAPPTGLQTCLKCGNKICDKDGGEDLCNCPADCQVVKSTVCNYEGVDAVCGELIVNWSVDYNSVSAEEKNKLNNVLDNYKAEIVSYLPGPRFMVISLADDKEIKSAKDKIGMVPDVQSVGYNNINNSF